MKRHWIQGLLTAALLAAWPLMAEEEESAAHFLERVRTRQQAETRGELEGTLQHLRKGGRMEEYPCVLTVRLGAAGARARMSVDGRAPVELPEPAGTKADEASSAALLARCGVRLGDLMMDFLQYRLTGEAPAETVRAVPCRVLELAAPDGSERAQVYIARDYLFPLKAVFFTEAGGDEPARTLEIASFKQQNGLYYAELINLRGPEWRSRVTFRKVRLAFAAPGDPLPTPEEPKEKP